MKVVGRKITERRKCEKKRRETKGLIIQKFLKEEKMTTYGSLSLKVAWHGAEIYLLQDQCLRKMV